MALPVESTIDQHAILDLVKINESTIEDVARLFHGALCLYGRGCGRTLLCLLEMSDDPQSEKERNKSAVVRIPAAATVSSSVEVHVRLIQQSPNADPRLVAMAREFAEE